MSPEADFSSIQKQLRDLKECVVALNRRASSTPAAAPRSSSLVIDFGRLAVCHLLSIVHQTTPADIAATHYPNRPDVARDLDNVQGLVRRATRAAKAAVSPATTTNLPWAGELAFAQTAPTFFQVYVPQSAYSRLTLRSPIRLEIRGTSILRRRYQRRLGRRDQKRPRAQDDPHHHPAWTDPQAGVISTFSAELADWGLPTIEAIISATMKSDTAATLDAKFLSADAATAIAPQGLRFGVAGLTSTSPAEDVAALFGAIAPAGDGVLLLSSANQIRLLAACPGLASLSMMVVDSLGDIVIAIDASDICSAENDNPEIRAGNDSVLQFQEPPIEGGDLIAAAPVISVWQHNLLATRLLQNVAWSLRRPGAIAWTTADWGTP